MILILVGGTGSLGKAIIAQQELLKSHGISKIRVISRDEQKQMSLTRSYRGDIPIDCYLGDVSDSKRMHFALKDAHFVIHAAAQKHIEKFELDIPTGFKTNIHGTENVAEAFMNSKNAVSGIFVSTDKAVFPITAYGVSKLAAQHSWLWNNSYQKSVKFGVSLYGNVFGSRGSVIETWTEAAKKTEILKVTDPLCTRFFIELPHAAQFVIRSLFKNESKVHYPRMKSSDLQTLAEVIWEYYHPQEMAPIEVIGMRGIEKLHESLSLDGEDSYYCDRLTKQELREMYTNWLRTYEA